MKKILSLPLIPLFLLTGCASYKDYYKLDNQYLARRQLETRYFETNDEKSILTASAQVLQDLGFSIEESETKLGLITGSKEREPYSTCGKVLVALAILGGSKVYDTKQKIYVTLVSTKNATKRGYNIRVEFARVIWDNTNRSRIEKIQDHETYQTFFDKLSQSVFLTANNL